MKFNFFKTFIYSLIFILIACDSNKWDIDTEKISIEQSFQRFELDLFEMSNDGLSLEDQNILLKDYPKFYPLYVEGVMGFGSAKSAMTLTELNQFVSNKDLNELYIEVDKKYPRAALNDEKEKLEEAFKRFHFYFPNRIVPEIITMISAFNYSTVVDDSLLAIGLDMYLGGDFPIYPQVGIPKYKFKNFEQEYIVPDALKAWLTTEFEEKGGKNLLEKMVFQGKISYLMEAFIGNQNQHLFFNYSPEEIQWCEENEKQAWFHFVDMELLFATDVNQIRKYMGDAPFVAGFPEGSPGRVGHWIGYKIVKSYMEENTDKSLADLMYLKDANKILRESNYKPKR